MPSYRMIKSHFKMFVPKLHRCISIDVLVQTDLCCVKVFIDGTGFENLVLNRYFDHTPVSLSNYLKCTFINKEKKIYLVFQLRQVDSLYIDGIEQNIIKQE